MPGSNGRPPACKARAGAAVYCRPSLRRSASEGPPIAAAVCCGLPLPERFRHEVATRYATSAPPAGGRRRLGPAPLHATCGGGASPASLWPFGSASQFRTRRTMAACSDCRAPAICSPPRLSSPRRRPLRSGGYECYISDAVNAGLVPDTVQAEGVVDPRAMGPGVSVQRTPAVVRPPFEAMAYVKTKSRRYTRLKRKHHLAAATTPCRPGTYRGVFRAVLRDPARRRVSVDVQKLGNCACCRTAS